MPIVNVTVSRAPDAQLAQTLAEGLTERTARLLAKPAQVVYLRDVFAFMGRVLGSLHEESYILVHDVRADAYGYGGRTQEYRYVRSELETAETQ